MTTRRYESDTPKIDWDEVVYLFLVTTFILFAIRDGLTGSIRYLFQILHVSFLWFIPDLMSFVAVGLFFYAQFFVKKNAIGMYFCYITIISTITSIFFMNSSIFSLFSSIKMFIPMFVGFCFYGRSVTERRWVRNILLVIFLASTVGLIVNPYVEYPWIGQTISSFGMEREATKLWWQEGGVRYGGLAGDSTMAAYMVMFTYVLISPYYGFKANILSWPLLYWAVQTSTSKTAIGVFYLYVLIYLAVYFLRDFKLNVAFLRLAARASFLCLIVPLAMMIFLHGAELGKLSTSLFSLQDRIDNTWPGPFYIVADIFPAGAFFGCGLGCFSYPMDYTSLADLNLPLDNFYMSTLIMMGMPFILFIVLQFMMIRYATDPVKLSLMTLFNFYSVTVQCYGPSYATLMFGYIFSEMFGHAVRGRKTIAPLRRPQPRAPREVAAGEVAATNSS